MSLLVLAEHDNATVNAGLLHTIGAAQKIGGDVHVLVTGPAAAVASEAARISGVTKVLHANAAHLDPPLAENIAATIVDLVRSGGYSHVLLAATGFGKNIAPRIAAVLDVAQISEIIAVESPDTFVRPIYAGNAFATVQSADPVKVLTVRTTAFDPVPTTGGSASVETVEAVADSGLAKVVSREVAKSERPELASARVVVSG